MLTPKQIWLVCEPIDMRKGIDGLTVIAQQLTDMTWQEGTALLFRNHCGKRMKLLSWDRHGVWLCQRRLYQGRFTWPAKSDTSWTISQAQFDWLVIGVDWQRLSVPEFNPPMC
jgi:transposase